MYAQRDRNMNMLLACFSSHSWHRQSLDRGGEFPSKISRPSAKKKDRPTHLHMLSAKLNECSACMHGPSRPTILCQTLTKLGRRYRTAKWSLCSETDQAAPPIIINYKCDKGVKGENGGARVTLVWRHVSLWQSGFGATKCLNIHKFTLFFWFLI